MWKIILSYWYGNEKLWKAFWILVPGSNFGIGVAVNAAEHYKVTSIGVVALLLVIIITIEVWVTVSVWRCAPNTPKKIWCWIVRIIIILSISNAVGEISTCLRACVVDDNTDINKEAIEAYKQSIRIDPDDTGAHFLLGLTYLDLNDRSSALEQYKILEKLDSEKANFLFNEIYK
jgi:tetratricopeptide (TPR) repeat protein